MASSLDNNSGSMPTAERIVELRALNDDPHLTDMEVVVMYAIDLLQAVVDTETQDKPALSWHEDAQRAVNEARAMLSTIKDGC